MTNVLVHFFASPSELKEKYANPDDSIGVQLEASIVLS
jgi:hypothetical protein